MRHPNMAMIALAIASLVASCALLDTPETGAKEWQQAIANMDGNKMMARTCASQQANVQQAGMWTSAISMLGSMFVGQQGKVDGSDMRFVVVRSSGDTAYVRVTGKIRVAILLVSQVQDVDETWKMVREDQKWKWCGQ